MSTTIQNTNDKGDIPKNLSKIKKKKKKKVFKKPSDIGVKVDETGLSSSKKKKNRKTKHKSKDNMFHCCK